MLLVDPICIRFASIRSWLGTFMLEVRKSPAALLGERPWWGFMIYIY